MPTTAQLKALAPNVSYVTLPPSYGAGDSASVPLFVHLTELDLTGSGAESPREPYLEVEKLQAAAPNLRVLRLDAAGTAVYKNGLTLGPEPGLAGPGFPKLRVCELGLSRATSATNSASHLIRKGSTIVVLRRVVGRSPLLHTLDVSGAASLADVHSVSHSMASHDPDSDDDGESSERVTAEANAAAAEVEAEAAVGPLGSGAGSLRIRLRQTLAPELRRALTGPLRVLRASRSVLASDAGLHALASLFGRSLQVLDVSESPNVTDAGLVHVARGCTALTSLDVSSTGITDWGVRCVVAMRCRGGGGPPGGLAGGAAGGGVAGARSRSAAAVIDLASSDSDDDDGDRGGGGLRRLDISSCRGVDRATRHAAAEGLSALRGLLRL